MSTSAQIQIANRAGSTLFVQYVAGEGLTVPGEPSVHAGMTITLTLTSNSGMFTGGFQLAGTDGSTLVFQFSLTTFPFAFTVVEVHSNTTGCIVGMCVPLLSKEPLIVNLYEGVKVAGSDAYVVPLSSSAVDRPNNCADFV